MKYWILFSILMFGISVNAQDNNKTNIPEVDSIFSPALTGETFTEIKYKGDPFFTNDWVKSDILLSTGEMVYNIKIKYNGLLDEVIWLNPLNFGKFILDKSYISDFWFNDNQGLPMHFKRINLGAHQPDIFAEVAVEGKVSLYIQHKIRVFGTENYNYDAKLYSIELIEPNTLYIIKLPNDKYAVMSRLNRNAILKLFPEQKKAILKIWKDNHLNFKSKSECLKGIGLLNKEVFK